MEDRQRIGALVHLPKVVRDLGADPAAVAAEADLRLEDLADSEGSITFDAWGRLFRACLRATGCPHFGLLMGQQSGLESLGVVGQLMRNAPDLRQAMLDLCVNQPRYVRGSVVYLALMGEGAFWGYGVHHSGMDAVEYISEAAIAVGVKMMRELTGLDPEQVLLTRSAPPDLDPYRRFYGVTPLFEAEQNAIVLPIRLLATPVRGADPRARLRLEKSVAAYWALAEPTASEKVSRMLRAHVILEPPTLESVARALDMHPRTLNRRLKAEGRTFRELLNETRFEVARQLLDITRIEIAAIGETLGYADPSGFTRAFARWSNLPPSQWRTRANAG